MTEPQVGDTIKCWRETEKQWQDCQILEIRSSSNKKAQFFVHFIQLNKRLDDWVSIDSFDLSTLTRKTGSKSRKSHGNANEEAADADQRFLGMTRNIEQLRLGNCTTKAWYFAPVPEPFFKLETLFCCEFCMRFFATENEFLIHNEKCTETHPPGDEIYRKDEISVYELDGAIATRYCVNLCLITKLFLYHKTQYYDPRFFYFYIACFTDGRGAHPCGFFSKEKSSELGYNLACFLSFPAYQNRGVGSFLIQLSYELSKIEKKPGSPEKPLSDLGCLAYRSYWKKALIKCFVEHKDELLSVSSISSYTGMIEADIKRSVIENKFLRQNDDGEYVFCVSQQAINDMKKKEKERRSMKLDPRYLRWTPYPKSAKAPN